MQILDTIEANYDNLTKSQKKFADYLRKNLADSAFMTITELSKKSKVSSSTITRFVKVIGYKSFSSFQQEIQDLAKKEITPLKEFRYWVTEKPNKNFLYDQIENAKAELDNLYSQETYSTMLKACQIMNKSNNIYILGSRSSFSMAYFFYYSLKRIKENVFLIENRNDDISINMQYVSKNDTLFVIGYAKYTKFTLKIMQFFSSVGSSIICVTDTLASPLAQYTKLVIVARNRLKIYFVTTITILNTLIIMLSKLNPETHIQLFEEENQVTKKLDVYEKA
ncbi:MurR/RpiR family transcriptional regulator [Acidaminococcus timonensis]|jgi:DNA-binding MurR/RpiR family transcriptional regulator|uniref:MurR/RpiR family transcriptional regulator n=1 Tax=Acidaminococcus timonensis TaxID=1871002 RepID=UPI003A5BE661